MYLERLGAILKNTPYVGTRYKVNIEKLKTRISSNSKFCDNLAIKIGSEMIKHMGENSEMRMCPSLAEMTWASIEPIQDEGNPIVEETPEKNECE